MKGFRLHHVSCLTLLVVAFDVGGATAQTPPSELPNGPTRVVAAKGSRLELKGVNGDVLITKVAGDQAIVIVARDAAAEVKVFMVTDGQGITICSVYPSKDPKKPNECLPGNKGRQSQGNPKDLPAVRFKVEVPDGVNMTASVLLGNLRSEGITGNLSLSSSRGDVAVVDGGSGSIQASVGLLGNVDALISAAAGGGPSRRVNLAAVGSGQIRVALPRLLRVFYSITTQTQPTIDPAFSIGKATGSLLTGHLGPAGDSDVTLTVDTGIAGRFVLRRAN